MPEQLRLKKRERNIEKFVDLISSIIDYSTDEMSALIDRIETRKYKKKDYLLKAGDICKGVHFINSGFCRVKYTDKKRVQTVHFAGENDFTATIESMNSGIPTVYSIEALEITEAFFISKETVDWACDNMKNGNKLIRIVNANYCALEIKKITNVLSPNPFNRYIELITKFPDIEQRIPQKIIASFLNITPVYLSMLKAGKVKNAVE